MTPRPVRVLLADDHAAIRAGLRLLLDAADDVEVVGEASDGTAAITNARALRPDVVLMDLRMPGVDGIEATRVITGEGLADVLVLTTFDLDEYVDGALRAGAAGFLLKSAEPAALLDAVRRVADGDGVLAPEVTRRLLAAFARGPAPDGAPRPASTTRPGGTADPAAGPPSGTVGGPPAPATGLAGQGSWPSREASGPGQDPRLADLTPREVDVLAALGRGLSNQGIATDLYITEATAKTHVSRVLAKLGVATRMQAAIVARDTGLA
ncbi:MAG: DNA-binding response regulator [Cellulosimicrobium sp.]|nr:DNA-binding response regulator [Cellulosimicrobium sp.]